jgi:hypothetical protein
MEYGNELRHWGVKGMKWGIRRYQNKDGSLTPAGKKRRAQLEAELSTLGKKAGNKSATPETRKPKRTSDMTDAEIRDSINRMLLEKQYYDTKRSLAASNPPQVSKGKRFINSVLNDVIAPAAKEAGRKWATKFMEDKLGVNKKNELQRLEDKWKKLDYKKKISDLEKGIKDNDDPYGLKDLESQWKVADYNKKIKDLENPKKEEGFDMEKAIKAYRNLTPDERAEIKDAAATFENIDKLRKKGNVD